MTIEKRYYVITSDRPVSKERGFKSRGFEFEVGDRVGGRVVCLCTARSSADLIVDALNNYAGRK